MRQRGAASFRLVFVKRGLARAVKFAAIARAPLATIQNRSVAILQAPSRASDLLHWSMFQLTDFPFFDSRLRWALSREIHLPALQVDLSLVSLTIRALS